jgi:hypothetical protein
MKYSLSIILLFCLFKQVSAQAVSDSSKKAKNAVLRAYQDTSWNINTLSAPTSAGASLIGVSPSLIQKPIDPSGFAASLLNATNNYTTIPNSYAVDFAPAWLFAANKISYTDFRSDNIGKNIIQTFDVSFAMKNVKDSVKNITNTTFGIGVKVSLFRGKINKKATDQVDSSYKVLSKRVSYITNNINSLIRNDTTFRKLLFDAGNHKLDKADAASVDTISTIVLTRIKPDGSFTKADSAKLISSLANIFKYFPHDPNLKAKLDPIKKNGESIDFSRYGWKLDLAGGISYYFPNQIYSNGTLNNAGVWLTGGYTAQKSNISMLGIVRYQYNPKQAYDDPSEILKQTDLNTIDWGGRILFATNDTKFSFGGEFVYRSIINSTVVKPSYRYDLSADYQIGKNQLISFSFGRDFDGTITKTGNLIAALNYIIGFGNNKSIKQ